jgi:hypothetical protein
LIALDKSGVEDGVLDIEELLQATQENLAANPIEVGASIQATEYEAGIAQITETNRAISADQVEVKFTTVGGEEVTQTLDQMIARRDELKRLIDDLEVGGITPGELESVIAYRTELEHLITVIETASAGAGLTIQPLVLGEEAKNELIQIQRERDAITDEIAVINISDPYSAEAKARLSELYEQLADLDGREAKIRFGTDTLEFDNSIRNIEERAAVGLVVDVPVNADTDPIHNAINDVQSHLEVLRPAVANLPMTVDTGPAEERLAVVEETIFNFRTALTEMPISMNEEQARSMIAALGSEIAELEKQKLRFPVESPEWTQLQDQIVRFSQQKFDLEVFVETRGFELIESFQAGIDALENERTALKIEIEGGEATNRGIEDLRNELDLLEHVDQILIDIQADPSKAEDGLRQVRSSMSELERERVRLEEALILDPNNQALKQDLAIIKGQIEDLTRVENAIELSLTPASVQRTLSGITDVDGAMAELQKSGMIYIRADSEEALREFIRVNNIDITDKQFKVFVDGQEVDNLDVKLGGQGGLIDTLNETFGPRYTAYLEAKYTPDSADGIIGQNEIIRTSFEDVATDWSAFLRMYSSVDDYPADVRFDFLQQRLNDLGAPEGINLKLNGDDALAIVHAVRDDIDTNLITPAFVAKLDGNADGFLDAAELAYFTGDDFDESVFIAELRADTTQGLEGVAQFKDATIALTDGGTTYTVYAQTEQAAADLLRFNRTVLDDKTIKVIVDGKEVSLQDIEEVQKYGQTVEDDGILVSVSVLDAASPVLREAIKLVNDVPIETRTLLLADGTTYVEVTTAAGAAAAGLDTEVTTVFDAEGNALEVVPLTLADAQKLNGTFNTNLSITTALSGGLITLITAVGLTGIAEAINSMPSSKDTRVSLTLPDAATLLAFSGLNSALTDIAATAETVTRNVAVTVTEGPPPLAAVRLELQNISFITNAELAKTIVMTIVQTGSTLTTILNNLQAIQLIPAPIEKQVNVPLTGMTPADMDNVVIKLRELAAINFTPLSQSAVYIGSVGTAISGLSGVVVTSLNVISEEVSRFSGKLIESGTTIATGFGTNFGAQLTGIRSEVGTAFGTVFTYIANSVVPTMQSWGRNVGQQFTYGIIIGMDVPAVYARAYAMAEAAYNATRNALTSRSPSRKMMEVGNDFTAGFIIGMEADADRVAQTGRYIGLAATSSLADTVTNTVGYLDEIFFNGIDQNNWLASIPAAMQPALQALGEDLREVLSGVAGGSQILDRLFQTIFQAAGTAGTELRGVFDPLDAQLGYEMGILGGAIINGWEKLEDGFWRFVQTGEISKGILTEDGSFVSPGFYDAGYQNAQYLAQGMIDGYTSTLQIASPSRVFMSIGQDIVRGLAQGIASEENQAVNAAHAMVDAIQSALEQKKISILDVLDARKNAGIETALAHVQALESRSAAAATLGRLAATQVIGTQQAVAGPTTNNFVIQNAQDPKAVGDEVMRRLHNAAIRNKSAGKVAVTTV